MKVIFLIGKMGIIIQEPPFNVVVRLEMLYTTRQIWRSVSTVNKRHKKPCFRFLWCMQTTSKLSSLNRSQKAKVKASWHSSGGLRGRIPLPSSFWLLAEAGFLLALGEGGVGGVVGKGTTRCF